MLVEHITLNVGGNSVMRDTADILPDTVMLLKHFEVCDKAVEMPFPNSPFTIKITSQGPVAFFDIKKNGQIAVFNCCCLSDDGRDVAVQQTKVLYDKLRSANSPLEKDFRRPVYEHFIYSFILNPAILWPKEMMIAGEIELYLFYSLYKAYKRKYIEGR
jgi:hypothetical protein